MAHFEMTRRNFIKTLGAGAAGLILSRIPSVALADGVEENKGYDITASYDADIVVVGAGISGLAAAVQAAQLGAKVTLLEANDFAGGNGLGTEGIFGCGTEMQKEAGIDFTFSDVIDHEATFFNYRINSEFWRNMVNNSADNIAWAIDNGVEFTHVDNYYGMGQVSSFHWFKDGKGENYVKPMVAKAEELGVQIMYSTRGMELKTDGDKITGIYAETVDGMIELNANAVILASGGYAANDETIEALGFDSKRTMHFNIGVHQGDGLRMAKAVGGADVSSARTYLGYTSTPGSVGFDTAFSFMQESRSAIFVNGKGHRYVREDCGETVKGITGNAIRTQEISYCIATDDILADIDANMVPGSADIMKAIAESNPDNNAFKADTIGELAALINVDADELEKTIADYNEMCANAKDTEFNKPEKYLLALNGPFYAFRQDPMLATSIGGIHVNPNMEVIDLHNNVVMKGLYAVGTDSCELYRETYTISIPASCQGNNLNSGRTAARNAVAYIEKC